MNNFTRSGSEAKYWLSTTNLSCCSIDSIAKQFKSLKVFSFIALFLFSMGAMQASNFIDGCMSDAPAGPSEAAIALTAMETCGDDAEIEVIKTSEMISHNTPGAEATDCDWEIIHSYHIKCNGVDQDPLKIHYFGGDRIPPSLDGELPPDIVGFNACFADAGQAGYDDDYIKSLFSDNCGTELTLIKTGSPVMVDNCSWTAEYKYLITDACGNPYPEFTITVSGSDQDPPELKRDIENFPTSEYDLDLCFENKKEGPPADVIAGYYEDLCGGPVIVNRTEHSKGYDCKWMAVYTYTIQDQCGNFVDPPLVLTYTGRDQSPYEFSGIPQNTTVDCIDQIPPAPDVTATDNCGPFLDRIDPVEDYSNVDACNGGIFTRTWTIIDPCSSDLNVTATQEITVLPTPIAELTPPEIPSNITCADAATWTVPDATYTNNIEGGACAISGSIEASYDRKFTECGGYIEISFNGKDACNRDLSAGPFMIIVDPAPPAVFNTPEGGELTCEEANVFQAPSLGYSNSGTGACLIEGEVPGVATPNYTECGGYIDVNWTYKDDCERDIFATVRYTVLPAPPAVFNTPEGGELTCEEANVFQAPSLGYSNSGTGACLIEG
ncbi:HYR-like domain-containing protein, partial [Ichthyenterobacterium magnum]|uniref:HYR-like domain-containing protein n=1 Tax=Ichthyenterobacterium magnum TaxID=1230530 RepID=UPI0013C32083